MDVHVGVGEMGFIFCGKHPLLVTRTKVSDPGPKGPLVSKLCFQKFISGILSELQFACKKLPSRLFSGCRAWTPSPEKILDPRMV